MTVSVFGYPCWVAMVPLSHVRTSQLWAGNRQSCNFLTGPVICLFPGFAAVAETAAEWQPAASEPGSGGRGGGARPRTLLLAADRLEGKHAGEYVSTIRFNEGHYHSVLFTQVISQPPLINDK